VFLQVDDTMTTVSVKYKLLEHDNMQLQARLSALEATDRDKGTVITNLAERLSACSRQQAEQAELLSMVLPMLSPEQRTAIKHKHPKTKRIIASAFSDDAAGTSFFVPTSS
jgi:septal ring factor EnvC (AmiA/AmiB activator)